MRPIFAIKNMARIYRIVWKDGKQPAPMSLDKATPEQLVAALKNDNMFWRRHAQRLLVERGNKDVVPALLELVKDGSVDELGLNAGAIHALWTLQGLGVLDGKDEKTLAAVGGALRHKSVGVRRNAAMVLPASHQSRQTLFESGVLADPDPQVKLASLLAIADLPLTGEAGDVLAEQWLTSAITRDRWLHDALITAAATHNNFFLAHVLSDKSLSISPAQKDVLKTVAVHFGREASVNNLGRLIIPLSHSTTEIAEVVLSGLAQGWPANVKASLSEEQEKTLLELLPKLSPAGQGDLVRLTSRWGSKSFDRYAAEVSAKFLEKVRDEKASDADRITAAAQYIAFRPADAAAALELVKQLTPAASPEFSKGILEALGRSESPELATVILGKLGSFTPSTRNAAIRMLMGRSTWTGMLLGAAEKGEFRIGDLSLDQQRSHWLRTPTATWRGEPAQCSKRGEPAQSGPAKDLQGTPPSHQQERRSGGRFACLQDSLRQVPHSRQRGEPHRPGSDWHGRAFQGGVARRYHRPQQECRGELSAIYA